MRNTGLASKSTERQTSPAKRGKRRIARRCPAFAQIKPAKINLSLFGRLNHGNANVLARTAKTPLSEQGDVKEEGIDLLVMPDD